MKKKWKITILCLLLSVVYVNSLSAQTVRETQVKALSDTYHKIDIGSYAVKKVISKIKIINGNNVSAWKLDKSRGNLLINSDQFIGLSGLVNLRIYNKDGSEYSKSVNADVKMFLFKSNSNKPKLNNLIECMICGKSYPITKPILWKRNGVVILKSIIDSWCKQKKIKKVKIKYD